VVRQLPARRKLIRRTPRHQRALLVQSRGRHQHRKQARTLPCRQDQVTQVLRPLGVRRRQCLALSIDRVRNLRADQRERAAIHPLPQLARLSRPAAQAPPARNRHRHAATQPNRLSHLVLVPLRQLLRLRCRHHAHPHQQRHWPRAERLLGQPCNRNPTRTSHDGDKPGVRRKDVVPDLPDR
jgi:hypothetical protein